VTDPASPPTERSGRVLLAFYSPASDNYWNSGRRVLRIGNTAVVTSMIADKIGCDVVELQATDPYPDAHDLTVERNVREQEDDAPPGDHDGAARPVRL